MTIEKKIRIFAQVDEPLNVALENFAHLKRVRKNTIVCAALRNHLDPQNGDNKEQMLDRRMTKIERLLERLLEADKVTAEAVGLLARTSLGVYPEDLKDDEKQARMEKINRRWPNFIAQLGEIIAGKARGIYGSVRQKTEEENDAQSNQG